MSDVPGCPIPRIDRSIVDAVRQFCDDSYCLEKTFEATGNASVQNFPYTLPFTFGQAASGDFSIVTIAFSDYEFLSDLDPIDPTFFQIEGLSYDLKLFEIDVEFTTLDQITPSGGKFYRFPTIGNMQIFPFNSDDSLVSLVVTLAMKPKIDVTSIDDRFFQTDIFREAIEAQSLYKLQAMPSRPWSNPNMAGVNIGNYKVKLGEARARRALRGFGSKDRATGGFFA